MSVYHRFVSYMYVYDHNQKTINNGFVRVETRDDWCHVELHLKNIPGNEAQSLKVYMIYAPDDGFYGAYLGDMHINRQQGVFEHRMTKDNVGGSKRSVDEMCGILVLGDQERFYATCWNEMPVDYRNYKGVYREEVKERPSWTVVIEPKEPPKLSPDPIQEPKASEPLQQSAQIKGENKGLRIEKMLNHYPTIDNLKNTADFDYCIRLELQDIGLLPMQYWSYTGNSFVLYSYCRYQHLLFGKKKDGQFILGVPGEADHRDQFMAGTFGFSDFMPVISEADAGYWCIAL